MRTRIIYVVQVKVLDTMTIDDIKDNDLREFLGWYQDFHGCRPVDASVITICMTGYFKTFAKAADKLLTRCKRLKLVAINDGVVTIVNNNE